MKACFFAHVADPKLLDLMEWYRQDIQILRDLGFDLVIATRFHEIAWDCDLYLSWWCTGSILPLVVAKVRQKPLVILGFGSEVANSTAGLDYNALPTAKRLAVRTCLRSADLVLSISQSMQGEALRLGRKDVPVLYLAVDSEYFKPDSDPHKQHILTISHLNKPNMERKALKTIVRSVPHVVEEFPEQEFLLVGAKLDAYQELARLATELGVERQIFFPGQISNEQKLRLLQHAVIYLQPTRHEGFGMAIAEAMSCGVPVITSRIGSVPEITGDFSVYVNPRDPEHLARATISLLKDPVERKERSQAGRQWIVDRFSIAQRREGLRRLLGSRFSWQA